MGYRLAPEDPFPAAVVDALAAYTWVQRTPTSRSPEGQVGVMGDSAGGNLAAVVALETRSGAGGPSVRVPPPVAQGLVYPAIDSRIDSESLRTFCDGFFLTRERWSSSAPATGPTAGNGVRRGSRRSWPTTIAGWLPALVVTAGSTPPR